MDLLIIGVYLTAHYILFLLCALGVLIRFVIFLWSLFSNASQTMKDFFHLFISIFYFISLYNFIVQNDGALILFFIILGFQFYVEFIYQPPDRSSKANFIFRLVNSRIVKITWCIALLLVAFIYKTQMR